MFRNTVILHIQAVGRKFIIILFALVFSAPMIGGVLGGAIGLGLRLKRDEMT